jgi:DNA repair and recombination protein RAD52
MSFTDAQIAMLQADLDGSQVKTRQQAGVSLSYIEGWAAIDTANKIFGFGEWGYHIEELSHIGTREVESKTGRKGWEVGYRARVRADVFSASGEYDDVGFGTGTDYNSPFAAHESAGKEAVTDALKRALKNFGYPFGLALYDKTQEHVDNGVPGPTVATDVKRAPTTQPSTPPSGSSEDFNPNFIDPGATVITWGKHKGKTLRVVGSSYADFMLKKIAEDGKPSKLQPILKAFADQRADEKAAELAATIAKGAAKEPDGSEGMTIGDIAQAFDVDPEGFINYD